MFAGRSLLYLIHKHHTLESHHIDVVIDANDISVAHRLPGNRHANKPRTIIAKFVRRVIRTDFMRKKANLRNVDGPKVYITDDLTKMRSSGTHVLTQQVLLLFFFLFFITVAKMVLEAAMMIVRFCFLDIIRFVLLASPNRCQGHPENLWDSPSMCTGRRFDPWV